MSILDAFNTSKIAWGLGTIAMQFGARYVVADLTEMQNRVLASAVAKRIVLCGMIFVATRDIMLSIILTVAIQIVLRWFFNERSSLCIIPKDKRAPNTNPSTRHVTREQYDAALQIVQTFRDQSFSGDGGEKVAEMDPSAARHSSARIYFQPIWAR